MGAADSRLASTLGPLNAWWSPRHKRFWVLVLLLLYTLGGFFLAPWVAKRELLAWIKSSYGLDATIQELRINPYVISAEATGVELRAPDGSRFIALKRLFANLQLRSLWRRALVFREVSLDKPYLNVVRDENGDLNLGVFLPAAAEETAAAEPGGMLRLAIDELALRDGVVDVRDEVPATDISEQLGPITIEISDLSTLPEEIGQQQVAISTPRGARLTWSGDLSLNPVQSAGSVKGEGPYLPLLYQYVQDDVNFEVTEGLAELNFDYRFALPPAADLELTIDDFSLVVRYAVALEDGQSEPFLQVPEARVDGGRFDLGERSLAIDALTLIGVDINTDRDADGRLQLQRLLASPVIDSPEEPAANEATDEPAPAPEEEAVAESAEPWNLSLGEFRVDALSTVFEDRALATPARIAVESVNASMRDITNTAGAEFPFDAVVTMESGGTLSAEGRLTVLPALNLQGTASIETLAVNPATPYVGEFAQVRVTDGVLDAQADISSTTEDALALTGALTVAGLEVRTAVGDERLVGWDSLDVDKLGLSLGNNTLDVSTVALAAPFLRVIINEDGTTNLQDLIVTPETPALASDAEPLNLTVGSISITDGRADFSDLALPFPFEVAIAELNGNASGLGTATTEPANLNLEGRVDEFGFAKVEGSVNPADPIASTDMRILFRNVEFPDLSPYTVKFAGRRIADGRLEVDLRYKLDQGRMQGDNKVVIDRLQLGETVDNPDAMDLPLGLAIALLKKPDGTIDIELPVSGDVNDPEFSIGGIVLRAFANLITKLVTSPFRLLGGLVGAETENFDRIDFEPGTAKLTPPEREKLLKLGEALGQRPQLALEIPGVVAPDADALALRTSRVDAAIDLLLRQDEGKQAEQLLTERRRRALESLMQERLPETDLRALKDSYQRPVDPARPDGRQTLDELAYTAQLRELLIAAEAVTAQDLEELAVARAGAIQTALTADGQLAAERITLVDRQDAKLDEGGWIPLKLKLRAVKDG
ncbi:MAG: DUF748 domain-containing protein [Gammaproteobacteria bacterium]|nr:DUF748 domain-containing protein [Gammaproteobacteria bacterium]